jgi:hypothetical protein
VDDAAFIVKQMYDDLARHPHDRVEVVRVSLHRVPDRIPYWGDGP